MTPHVASALPQPCNCSGLHGLDRSVIVLWLGPRIDGDNSNVFSTLTYVSKKKGNPSAF